MENFKKLLTISIVFFYSFSLFSQVGINTTGNAANAAAMLDIVSTSKGLLIPRMTEVQRTSIGSPVQGLLVYQTNNTEGFYFHDGSGWVTLGTTSGMLWTRSGTNTYLTNGSDNLGIGVSNPTAGLHITTSTTDVGTDASLGENVLIDEYQPSLAFLDKSSSTDKYVIHLNQNIFTIGRYTDATTMQDDFVMNSGRIGIGTASPDASAVLEMEATDKGVLVPRITLNSATDPVSGTKAEGLMVYNDSGSIGVNGFYYWDGTAWKMVYSGTDYENGQKHESLTSTGNETVWKDMGDEYQWKETPTDLEMSERNYTCIGKVVISDFYEIDGETTSDTWTATNIASAPSARYHHTAVWTGTEMIVWGGYNGGAVSFNTGGRYNPTSDSWTATSTTNVPVGRKTHSAIWTGSEMIVFGGHDGSNYLNTGGKYNPASDTWVAITTSNAPSARREYSAIWTGTEMIIWGGTNATIRTNTGGRYNPLLDSWTATSVSNAPSARTVHTAVWTGGEMIVWGGGDGSTYFNTGSKYNPSSDSWFTISITGAPTARIRHTAVWTGTEMIVWGGYRGAARFNTGGKYNPVSDSWTATSTTSAPSPRFVHGSVWTGTEMIIWGGRGVAKTTTNTGGVYNSTTNSWRATSTTGAPSARYEVVAVWAGNEMITWGGYSGSVPYNTGGKLSPANYPTFSSSSSSKSFYMYRKGQSQAKREENNK